VHSDIERGFIRAEVNGYDDLVASRGRSPISEPAAAATRGQGLIVRDGEICHFRFNVGKWSALRGDPGIFLSGPPSASTTAATVASGVFIGRTQPGPTMSPVPSV